MNPITHLEPRNCPSLGGKNSALTQSSKTPESSEGARQLAVTYGEGAGLWSLAIHPKGLY